jgi:hypothetical protein
MIAAQPIGAMNDVIPLAVVKDYSELHLALRARKEFLQISNETLSELSGGTSNNCHRSSGAPNLPANDSALFSF